MEKERMTWESVDFRADGYVLGTYRIATAPRAELQPADELQVELLR